MYVGRGGGRLRQNQTPMKVVAVMTTSVPSCTLHRACVEITGSKMAITSIIHAHHDEKEEGETKKGKRDGVRVTRMTPQRPFVTSRCF